VTASKEVWPLKEGSTQIMHGSALADQELFAGQVIKVQVKGSAPPLCSRVSLGVHSPPGHPRNEINGYLRVLQRGHYAIGPGGPGLIV